MDAIEALFSRRSIRRYTTGPVSVEVLREILDAAMSAPSAGCINYQNIRNTLKCILFSMEVAVGKKR